MTLVDALNHSPSLNENVRSPEKQGNVSLRPDRT